jgi:hypothetical protein
MRSSPFARTVLGVRRYSQRTPEPSDHHHPPPSPDGDRGRDDHVVYPSPSPTIPYSERRVYHYQPGQKRSIILQPNNPVIERFRGKYDRFRPRKTPEDEESLDDLTRSRNADPYCARVCASSCIVYDSRARALFSTSENVVFANSLLPLEPEEVA